MWRMTISYFSKMLFVLVLVFAPVIASAQKSATQLEAIITIVELAGLQDQFVEAYDAVIDGIDEAAINAVAGIDVWSTYGEIISGDDFQSGTGLLFDISVLETKEPNHRFVLPPILVGSGENADTVALQAMIGIPKPHHETYAADVSFLKDYGEISSLPGSFEVSDKSRLFWLYKTGEGNYSIYQVRDGKGFWAKARTERMRFLLQKSVITGLDNVDKIYARARQYSELAKVYEKQIRDENLSGQILNLQTQREKSANQLVDSLQKLQQAGDIMKSLKGLQAFQDFLSVASIVNSAANSAVNQAQLEEIQADIKGLSDSVSEMNNSIANMQARLDYLNSTNFRLSTELNTIEININNFFIQQLQLSPNVVPEAQTILTP